MTWLWISFDEFKSYVQPQAVDRASYYNIAKAHPLAMRLDDLFEAVQEFESALNRLGALGFGDAGRLSTAGQNVDAARGAVVEMVHAGELILLHHKRLALSDASYGFLSQHGILEHWTRYAATDRLVPEINRLMDDGHALMRGYREITEIDNRFLSEDLDIPGELATDFRTARDLFSVGLDEVAVLLAARGFEGVLRHIARRRRLELVQKGKPEPAHDADLHELVEIFYRLRWQSTGERLISQEMRSLLHFLRTVRNSTAHSGPEREAATLRPRETATLIASAAGTLHQRLLGSKARLQTRTVERTW